ncbi:non-ribosomal peptide synthetase, partial [Chitinivorax sp. B]|uniref:non-ribosomal peptide synthetase n=1 Tax=Chitinivorax sp. B TaxID=2502235 RepID=UPI0010F64641
MNTTPTHKYSLSVAQQEILFHQMRFPDSPMYNIGGYVEIRQEIDFEKMAAAFGSSILENCQLHVRIDLAGGDSVQQLPLENKHVAFQLIDMSDQLEADVAARQWLQICFTQAFSLEEGPLYRAGLIRLAPDRYWYYTVAHHIIIDGWGFTNWLKCVFGHYMGSSPAEIRAAGQSIREERAATDMSLAQSARFWQQELGSLPALLCSRRSGVQMSDGARCSARIVAPLSPELVVGLRRVCATSGVTEFSLFLALLHAYFARIEGRHDTLFGIPVHNRRNAQQKQAVNMAMQVGPLLVRAEPEQSVVSIAADIARTLRRSYRHIDYPLSRLHRDLGEQMISRPFLFDVNFNYQKLDFDFSILGLDADTHFLPNGHEQTPLTLTVCDYGADQGVQIQIDYHQQYFDADSVATLASVYLQLLAETVADPVRSLGSLNLVSAEMAQCLQAWNANTAVYPGQYCLHELFEQQVRKTPDAIAVLHAGTSVSYRELDQRATRLAHALIQQGVGPDRLVAVCLARGVDLLVGLLAVLKSGGAYVPLDPHHPAERLVNMLEDAKPTLILTQAAFEDHFAGTGVPIQVLDANDLAVVQHADDGLPMVSCKVDSRHLAYVIFTSGSTGKPKGVMIEHRSVANLLSAMQRLLNMDANQRMVALTTISFDIAGLELFLPLISGAAVVVADHETSSDPAALARLITDTGAKLVQATPATWSMLLDNGWTGDPKLTLLCGGEALSAHLATRLLAVAGAVWNVYGPTETTIWSTAHQVSAASLIDVAHVTIGRPLANTSIHIVDSAGQPVPIGAVGELLIGGDGVARGYLNQPDLTAARFIADPFSHDADARLYRTGDLGRWRADGSIEFLGRNDHQVKLRGFRIELGEIEVQLAAHPALQDAVVIAWEGMAGPQLAAYYRLRPGMDEPGGMSLHQHLAKRLPAYMLPSSYMQLDSWPMTPNGKLDRKALPVPSQDMGSQLQYEAPLGEREQQIAAVWASLLQQERIGRHDSFFMLGGHSLLAVQAVSRLRQVLALDVTLKSLFSSASLADFAANLSAVPAVVQSPVPRTSRDGVLPLSFAQQRLWFLDQLEGAGRAYLMAGGLRLQGQLDCAALQLALDELVARHESLRTRFTLVDGQPVQDILAEHSGFRLLHGDLQGHPEQTAEFQRIAALEAETAFDLEAGPLVRGQLLRLADDDHVLLVTMHHIVSDGWSMGVFIDELSRLYARHCHHDINVLPALAVQYADYAVWQRHWLQGEVLYQQATYWQQTLQGAPGLLELPTDRRRPDIQVYEGAAVELTLDRALTTRLKALSKRHQTTLYTTLLTGWAILLARLSGQADVVIGSPVANRHRAELEPLIGLFANTLALRVDTSGSPTVAELLARATTQVLDAQAHQDLPFDQVVELLNPPRNLSHTPLFQVMFSWQNTPASQPQLPGLMATLLKAPLTTAQFDLSLNLGEGDGVIVGELEYATSLFEQATIVSYLEHWQCLLAAMCDNELSTIDTLPLLSTRQWQQLSRFAGDAAIVEVTELLPARFGRLAAQYPDLPAVVDADQQLSYAELEAQSNRLAHYLLQQGVQAEQFVAFCVTRSILLPV